MAISLTALTMQMMSLKKGKFEKLKNKQYGIRACPLEKFPEINKRTGMFIPYSRVSCQKFNLCICLKWCNKTGI